MTTANMQRFQMRLQAIQEKHERLANGYVTKVGPDGLIIARPRSKAAQFPWRNVLFVLLGIIGLKASLYSYLGEAAYEAQVVSFQSGPLLDQIVGFALVADPATKYLGTLATNLTF